MRMLRQFTDTHAFVVGEEQNNLLPGFVPHGIKEWQYLRKQLPVITSLITHISMIRFRSIFFNQYTTILTRVILVL